MNNKKRFLLFVFSLILIFLTACTPKTSETGDNTGSSRSEQNNANTQSSSTANNIASSEINSVNNSTQSASNSTLPPEPVKVDSTTLNGKVICGYQGWFGTANDGYTERGWMHWANDTTPSIDSSGKQTVAFEMFPDLYEYNSSKLSEINFENLPDGREAALFSSYDSETIDLHFKWMQEYGIDGVALQRFLGEALSWRKQHTNIVAANVKNSAEKYGRAFYLCYDFSGADNADFVESVKKDFAETIEGSLMLTASGNYLRHEGKPVVQLWGIGINGSWKRSADEAAELINFFKQKGYYVIGGTPTYWRTETEDALSGYSSVYSLYDMISPWTVGRFSDSEGINRHYNNIYTPDSNYLKATNRDFMPVVFPGFSWSIWNGGNRNQISRQSGEFLKKQLELAKHMSPIAVYVAMFDEYDEGTAIMKAASDSSELPKNSYFLTTSADGTYISSDYYLRLVGTFTEQFGNNLALNLNIPYSDGPFWFKTGFEKDTDAQPKTITQAQFNVLETTANNGRFALKINSSTTHKLFDINIPVNKDVVLTYYVYIDKLPKNQTTVALSVNCSDQTAYFQNIITNSTGWQKVTFELGKTLEGKIITSLSLNANYSDNLTIVIDDICIKQ